MDKVSTTARTWEDELLDGAQEFETNGGAASRKFRGKAISPEAMRTAVAGIRALLPVEGLKVEDEDLVEMEIDKRGRQIFDVDATIENIRAALTETISA